MKDVLQSYGNTWCNDNFNLPFDRAKLEEVHYWSKQEAKEWLEEIKEEEFYQKDPLYYENMAKERMEEGIYEVEYSYVVEKVSEAIADTVERISYKLAIYSETPLQPHTLRVILLIFLMFDYSTFNIFDGRPNEYIRGDLLKLFVEMNRNRIHLDCIPCNEYNDGINTIYDIYREYDYRWFGMNEPERFLQYTEDPTKQVDQEPGVQYENPIPELERELNRLKGNNT